jgi:methyltransferase
MIWYVLLIGAIAVERLAEVVVAECNRAWRRSHGGVEFGTRPAARQRPEAPRRAKWRC